MMETVEIGELYRSESRDHLDRLGRAVLALEKGAGKVAVDDAFRSVHTLKGMSAAMGYAGVVALSHGLEHLLEQIRNGSLAADAEATDLMLKAVDELERMVEEVVSAPRSGLARSQSIAPGSIRGAASAPGPTQSGRLGRYVRVEQERLDSLMNRAGELVIARERLLALARSSGDAEMQGLAAALGRSVVEMRDDALRLRLAPVNELSDRLHRLAREAGRALGREVRLDIVGGEVEIDRALLGDLADLLTHLIRNAVDHGIEAEDVRLALGKPPIGTVRITAEQSRDSVVVRVCDDGRGIESARVLEQAAARGMKTAGSGETPSDPELLELLIRPGFSTATRVTEISGRGVGLDHVASRLRELGGDLHLLTNPGTGATFSITLPKTLSLTRVLFMTCGQETLVVPSGVVERVEDEEMQGAWVRGDGLQASGATTTNGVADLGELCGYCRAAPPKEKGFIIVLGKDGRAARVRVDSVSGFQEVVIKRFAIPRGSCDVFAGATVLADGRPRLVVDPARLIARALSCKPEAPSSQLEN